MKHGPHRNTHHSSHATSRFLSNRKDEIIQAADALEQGPGPGRERTRFSNQFLPTCYRTLFIAQLVAKNRFYVLQITAPKSIDVNFHKLGWLELKSKSNKDHP